jgi:hypothetical protein
MPQACLFTIAVPRMEGSGGDLAGHLAGLGWAAQGPAAAALGRLQHGATCCHADL